MKRPATQNSPRPAALRWSQLLFVVLAAATCGCAGPWAGQANLPLPATGSTPSGEDVTAPRIRTLPHLETEPSESSSTEEVDIVVRGQSASDGSDGYSFGELGGIGSAQDSPKTSSPQATASQLPSSGIDKSGVQLAQYEMPTSTYDGGDYNTTPDYGSYGSAPSSNYSGTPGYGSVPSYGGTPSYGTSPSYDAPPYAPQSSYGAPDVYSAGQLEAGAQGGYGPGNTTYDGSGVDSTPFSAGSVVDPLPADYADLVVNLRETQTGRFMFGVGVNSDLGLTAQAIIDERNFDWRRWPRSLDEVINGTAWRGGGQTLRIEAVPGTEVQRYMVNFTQPYLFDTPISFNVSGYLFDRRYFDWDEQRLGGRIGFGYRITPDLSLGLSLRGEQVDFHDPRVQGISEIDRVLGKSDLFSGKVTLTHDTRDIPFAPTEGHYLEMSYEQVFGSFDYPRGNIDYRRYFLLRQRADGSGRHTVSFSFKGGITGSQTPVYENFFAGGHSTLRGFRFRHASPKGPDDVILGGQLSLLGSAEYIFPITADDMLKGALFCDYGTVEESYKNIEMDDFRVAVGAGVRVNVPAMGPAPIAVDFSVPIAREGTDRIQNFSFFMGMMR